MLSYRATLPRA